MSESNPNDVALKILGERLETIRLSLFGAWHLGSTLDERRKIRKALRDAYDTASRAVHSGEVKGKSEECLGKAQDLCRHGIIKLLRKGAPEDWGDLILGDTIT